MEDDKIRELEKQVAVLAEKVEKCEGDCQQLWALKLHEQNEKKLYRQQNSFLSTHPKVVSSIISVVAAALVWGLERVVSLLQ